MKEKTWIHRTRSKLCGCLNDLSLSYFCCMIDCFENSFTSRCAAVLSICLIIDTWFAKCKNNCSTSGRLPVVICQRVVVVVDMEVPE